MYLTLNSKDQIEIRGHFDGVVIICYISTDTPGTPRSPGSPFSPEEPQKYTKNSKKLEGKVAHTQ